MRVDVGDGLAVDIMPRHDDRFPQKLAEAAVYFTAGPLAGLCLLDFGVWQSREDPTKKNVSVPGRRYVVNGEQRTFGFLRIDHALDETKEDKRTYYAPLDGLKRRIMQAYTTAVSAPVDDAPVEDAPDDDLGW